MGINRWLGVARRAAEAEAVKPEPLPPAYEPAWNERGERFVVLDRTARMPANCYGRYRRVGVVEVTPEVQRSGREPKMLSQRALDVRRVVKTWERLYWGSTERCAYQRALAEAEELAENLNKVALYV